MGGADDGATGLGRGAGAVGVGWGVLLITTGLGVADAGVIDAGVARCLAAGAGVADGAGVTSEPGAGRCWRGEGRGTGGLVVVAAGPVRVARPASAARCTAAAWPIASPTATVIAPALLRRVTTVFRPEIRKVPRFRASPVPRGDRIPPR